MSSSDDEPEVAAEEEVNESLSNVRLRLAASAPTAGQAAPWLLPRPH